MNILHLTTHMNAGGITTYILCLTREYRKNGHAVTVISSGGELENQFTSLGATIVNFDIRVKSEVHPKLLMALPKIFRFIRQNNIDVIHTHTRITQVMGTVLHLLTGTTHVATCHGFYKTRWSRRLLPCWGDAVVAISPAVEEHLLKDFHTPASKVFYVAHGVDIPQYSPMPLAQRREGLKARNVFGSPVIGIMARLADIKGHDILIRAMPMILGKFPSAQLVIVGTGKMEQHLHALVEEMGLTQQVLFFPVVHQAREFMPLFDISVLPSLEEGLGLSVLEAQACALPVVASNVGGLKTLVQNGITGILVEPGNPQAIADAILEILREPQRALEMGKAARRFIQEKHSAVRMAHETFKIYETVLAGQKQ